MRLCRALADNVNWLQIIRSRTCSNGSDPRAYRPRPPLPIPIFRSGCACIMWIGETKRLNLSCWCMGDAITARNWDWVAQSFRDTHHIIAPDLRGHGDSQWMIGGTYDLTDFVYGHCPAHSSEKAQSSHDHRSLHGRARVALRYAGLYPETVKKLVVIEGPWSPLQR